MSNIYPQGSINPNGFLAPGVYVQEILPSALGVGVQTNIIGNVGTASWGPVNSPVVCGSMQEQVANFGYPTTSQFDMGTAAMAEFSIGASQVLGVRVTDGTDLASTIDILDTTTPTAVTGMTLNAKYTGSVGNTINVIVSAGTNTTLAAPTFKVTILFPTGISPQPPEIYDNIGGTGAALWQNIVDAINMGQGGFTAPSQLVVATIGTATNPPALSSYTLAGGTDGNSGVVSSDLVGSNVLPLTGMYALTETGFDMLVLAGVTDSTTYLAQAAFCLSQGAYAMLAAPLGDSYATVISTKKTVGLDSTNAKLFPGDTWVRINDEFNNVQRYIPQQGFAAAMCAILAPQEVLLNKQINSGIFLSTYYADNNLRYTSADIVTIEQNGLDTIANPSVGGSYWSFQTGKNTSSNVLASFDNFPRLTGFLASSLQIILGPYVGSLMSSSERNAATAAIISLLQPLSRKNVIGSSNGGQPYSVQVVDGAPGTGIQIANVSVAYLQVLVAFVVNLKTGLVSVGRITPNI